MPREVWDVGKVRQESQRERDIASQLHRDAMANRAKQEEHAARETAKKQASEARRESNRAAAKERRVSRAKAREKSGRAARLMDDDISAQVENPYLSLPSEETPSVTSIGEPIDYWQPTLTGAQGEAITALGTSPTVVEIAGARIGTETQNLIAKIREDATPGAGGWFSAYYDEIVMPTSTFEGRNLDQVTRHELLHRLTEELMDSGALSKIALPEMQSILERFDNFQGEATVADFINFVQMNSPTDESGVVPATGAYANRWYEGERFDPRARTAGWDYSRLPEIQDDFWGNYGGRLESYDISGRGDFSTAPWVGSGEKGKKDFDEWMAFQRELPSEKYGGAVMGAGEGETVPWGPATVNYQWVKEEFTDSQGKTDHTWKRVPISTGTPGPTSLGHVTMQGDIRTEAGIPLVDQGPVRDPTDYGSQTGLGNWPMGDEHALLAAQAARFDLPGQEDYVNQYGETGDFYGRMARFNRAAALKAHPDSRIRAITEAGLPDIVLDKLTEVLSSGGDELWGEAGSYEGAVKYITQLVQQYQSGQLEDNLVAQN